MSYNINKCDSLGLKWWTKSEHGGPSQFNGNISGDDKDDFTYWEESEILGDKDSIDIDKNIMWRWQTLTQYSFPEIIQFRNKMSV